MSPNTRSLSIAIIGVGRIGSSFAYQLASAGHDVTVVARPSSRRLAQLERDGGIVLTTGERAMVTSADHLDTQKAYDLVLVTVNAHQVDAVLPALRTSRAKAIQFMFITPEAARLQAAVGADRTTFGFAGVLAVLRDDGKLDLQIPKRNPKALHGDQRWVDLFEAAGMPSKLEPQMERRLRAFAPMTMSMEAVAISGMQHRRGATWAEARAGARGAKSAYAILRELGDAPYPGMPSLMSRAPLPVTTFMLWGISRARFREAIGTSQEECRGLVDLLVAEARHRGANSANVNRVLAMRPESEETLAAV
jgi:2-dehydropantoate 2-reductase